MCCYNDYLVIEDTTKLESYAEHKGKFYYVYFRNIPRNMMYYRFDKRYEMEKFLYFHKIEGFYYKSSNGQIVFKIWENIPAEIDEWREDCFRTKKEKQQGFPDKYTWDAWSCGHFVKEKK